MLPQVAFHRASVESESAFELWLSPAGFRAEKTHPMQRLAIVFAVRDLLWDWTPMASKSACQGNPIRPLGSLKWEGQWLLTEVTLYPDVVMKASLFHGQMIVCYCFGSDTHTALRRLTTLQRMPRLRLWTAPCKWRRGDFHEPHRGRLAYLPPYLRARGVVAVRSFMSPSVWFNGLCSAL